jgi:hypothetical protein
MKNWVDWSAQKAVAVAIPARNAESIPVARKSVAESSDGVVSTFARFLPLPLRLIALADIAFFEPDRRRNKPRFAELKRSQILLFSAGLLATLSAIARLVTAMLVQIAIAPEKAD